MRKYLSLALVLSFVLFSCNNRTKTNGHQIQRTDTTVIDMHTAEISLDYCGIYEGTLPAADCPGIKTKLTINKNGTFSLHSEYIDKKDGIFDENGNYSVEGNILTLKQNDGQTSYYKIEEGKIRMLNTEKQPITGQLAENYVLKQTKVF